MNAEQHLQPLQAEHISGAPGPRPGSVALVGARVVDGKENLPGDRLSTVLIRDGRIVWLGDVSESVEADEHIQLDGRTLMPGLIDVHVHLSEIVGVTPAQKGLEAGVRPYAHAQAARQMLDAGITTVRDLGSYGSELFALREAAGAGLCTAPRLLLCGQIVAVTSAGGRRSDGMYREADGADELRKATREQRRQGADFIKLNSTGALTVADENIDAAQMTKDEVAAVVSEAHRLGLRVASHAEGVEGIRLSLDAGVDTIEHGEQLFRAPDCLEAMAVRGVTLVPTLSVFHAVADNYSGRYSRKLADRAKQLREDAYATVSAAQEAGVPVAMGFDSFPHGANAIELVRLVDAGLTTGQAISAATYVAAAACGLVDVGRVEIGMLADLLVIDGDPLTEITLLADPASIWLVLQAGQPRAGTALASRAFEPLAGHP